MSGRVVLRPEVRKFAERMEENLRRYDQSRGPTGWHGESVDWLANRILEEHEELRAAIESGNLYAVCSEAADVGNFAMMVADVAYRYGIPKQLPTQVSIKTELVWNNEYTRCMAIDPFNGDNKIIRASISVHQRVDPESMRWKPCDIDSSGFGSMSIERARLFAAAWPIALGIAERWNAERAGKQAQPPAQGAE